MEVAVGNSTSISWTDATWNPIRGCTRVSAGCVNCYAERVANRFSGPGKPYAGLISKLGRWNGVVRMVTEHLADPLRWKAPRRIFVNSMSDLFHEGLSNEEIAAVFGVMAAAPQHTFQVLTKRATRMREWFEWLEAEVRDQIDPDETRTEARAWILADCAAQELGGGTDRERDDWYDRLEDLQRDGWARDGADGGTEWSMPWPLPNVWLGVSVENQAAADERVPELLATPAAIRFLSCEPLIGPVVLPIVHVFGPDPKWTGPRLDWVIAGCESGPGARECEVTWLRSLRDQCSSSSTAFFLKQAVKLRGGDSDSGDAHRIEIGSGSKAKAGGVIELPYLDGEQHAAFPEVSR
jgi:protein gp37